MIVRAGRKAWDQLLKAAPADKITHALAAIKALEDEERRLLLTPTENSDDE